MNLMKCRPTILSLKNNPATAEQVTTHEVGGKKIRQFSDFRTALAFPIAMKSTTCIIRELKVFQSGISSAAP